MDTKSDLETGQDIVEVATSSASEDDVVPPTVTPKTWVVVFVSVKLFQIITSLMFKFC